MKHTWKKSRIMAIWQIMFAMGIVGYWLFYFLMPNSGRANFLMSAEHAAFEAAFPAADALLAVALIASGICLWRGNLLGGLLSGAAGGALVFLGVLDVCFNFQNGIYVHGAFMAVLNVTINGWCIGFGLWLLRCTYQTLFMIQSGGN